MQNQFLLVPIVIVLLIFILLAWDILNYKKRLLRSSYKILNAIFTDGKYVCYSMPAENLGKIDFITKNSKSVLGYNPHVFTRSKLSLESMVHPDDLSMVKNIHSNIRKFAPKTFEYRYKKPDGNYTWLQEYIFPASGGGKPLVYFGIISDISAEVKNRSAEGKSLLYLHSIFENSAIPALILDKNCNQMMSNRTAHAFFESDIITDSLHSYLDEETMTKISRMTQSDYSSGEIVNILECTLRTAKQNERYVRLSISKLSSENKQFVMQLEDLTEQKELAKRLGDISVRQKEEERLLTQSARMAEMGGLLDIIIHQWKQPISALYATADLLEDEITDPGTNAEDIIKKFEFMKSQLYFMSMTTETFRSFFKSNEALTEFNMLTAVDRTVAMLKDILRQDNIEIMLESLADKNSLKLKGNMNELQQVILNMLLNARDAINERRVKTGEKTMNGMISVKIKPNESGIDLSVMDNGTGIPEEMNGSMFEAYKTTKNDGTGIGMYASRLIISKYPNSYMKAENHSNGATITMHIGGKEVEIKV